jgi:hypothetical protein
LDAGEPVSVVALTFFEHDVCVIFAQTGGDDHLRPTTVLCQTVPLAEGFAYEPERTLRDAWSSHIPRLRASRSSTTAIDLMQARSLFNREIGRALRLCDHALVVDLRWDGDERGEGVADATAFADGAVELIDAMRRPKWVAEEPELHLLPHIERACKTLPFEIHAAGVAPDGAFDVRLRWTGEGQAVGEVRAAVFALVGTFAEISTHVRQRRITAPGDEGETLVFDVVTGMLGDGVFSPHGHTVRVSVPPST